MRSDIKQIKFESREEFRDWLTINAATSPGIYLIMEKNHQFTYNDALEEALCFGFIDSTLISLPNDMHLRYFAKRQKVSKWSEKNKNIVEKLILTNKMTPLGLEAINNAKENGMWDKKDEKIDLSDKEKEFIELIKHNKKALENYLNMANSIKKTYLLYFLDAKREETKKSRLVKIINRLEQNLKPM